jgi:hypothetical protein
MLESPVQCAEEIFCYGVIYTTAVTPPILENERRETLAGSAERYGAFMGTYRPLKCSVGAPQKYGSSKKVTTFHTASIFLTMLRSIFPVPLISRFGDIFGLHDLRTSRSLISWRLMFFRTRSIIFEELRTRVQEESRVISQGNVPKALSILLSRLKKICCLKEVTWLTLFSRKRAVVYLYLICSALYFDVALPMELLQILGKCKISQHFLPHTVHYRRFFESLRTWGRD